MGALALSLFIILFAGVVEADGPSTSQVVDPEVAMFTDTGQQVVDFSVWKEDGNYVDGPCFECKNSSGGIVSPNVPQVPLPASVWMMIAGFGVLVSFKRMIK